MSNRGDLTSNAVIEENLREGLSLFQNEWDGDAVAYFGPIMFGVEDDIRSAIESIAPKRPRLFFIIETVGGYIEVAERIARCLRHHYNKVEFIVPNFAMSAGTVLVMSGDAIHMDYFSVLGPIDPQVQQKTTGDFIPALGYLEQFRRFVAKSAKGELTDAELNYVLNVFDPAELYRYEQERELSITLLRNWLANYKFRNWKKTKSRGIRVTKGMRSRRASEVAKKLNDTGYWHTHSRGIPMEVLRRDLRLEIEDFGEDEQRSGILRAHYTLLRDYMMRRSHRAAILTVNGYDGV